MDNPVARFPFTMLFDEDQLEPKYAERISHHINSLMEVGRWHHMGEDAQIAMDIQVLHAVREMHLHCVRENLHHSYLEVVLYDPVGWVEMDMVNEIKIVSNPPWIKLITLGSQTNTTVKEI